MLGELMLVGPDDSRDIAATDHGEGAAIWATVKRLALGNVDTRQRQAWSSETEPTDNDRDPSVGQMMMAALSVHLEESNRTRARLCDANCADLPKP